MKRKSIEEVIAYLTPAAEKTGVEIIEATWTERKGECALSIFLDAPGGVDLNLCERFHLLADVLLDELDPTFGAPYTLNCSSAGLDRPFKTLSDYQRHIGEKVEIHLYAAENGKKQYEGSLLACDGKTVSIASAEGEKQFSLEKIAKACLFIDI